MVLMVDDEKVTEQLLQQLLKFLPGPDQMKQLQDMKGVFKDLSDAEQFCAVVSSTGGQHFIATLRFVFIPRMYCTYLHTVCTYIYTYMITLILYIHRIHSKNAHIRTYLSAYIVCTYICICIYMYVCRY